MHYTRMRISEKKSTFREKNHFLWFFDIGSSFTFGASPTISEFEPGEVIFGEHLVLIVSTLINFSTAACFSAWGTRKGGHPSPPLLPRFGPGLLCDFFLFPKLKYLFTICVKLWYFKLRLFDITELIVWNIKGLPHWVSKIKNHSLLLFIFRIIIHWCHFPQIVCRVSFLDRIALMMMISFWVLTAHRCLHQIIDITIWFNIGQGWIYGNGLSHSYLKRRYCYVLQCRLQYSTWRFNEFHCTILNIVMYCKLLIL